MFRKNLFKIFWVLVVVVLLLFSLVFKDSETAIVAQVEPMKKAISYHKAVRVEEIYVMPGQLVQPGDSLVRVTRPDLVLDVEKKRLDLDKIKLDRQTSDIKYHHKLRQFTEARDEKIRKLDTQIKQLEMIVDNNQHLSSQFGTLTGYADTVQQLGNTYYQVELQARKAEKGAAAKQYHEEVSVAKEIYDREQEALNLADDQLAQELEVLLQEKKEQVKRAEIHGTVGSVNAQAGELLSPYTTILSVYEANPTMIKAVMNEGYKYELNVGSKVVVESSYRDYHIDGTIVEIGSRIIEYPNRLKTNQHVAVWGRELFVRIPEQNSFLNGERVFVMIK